MLMSPGAKGGCSLNQGITLPGGGPWHPGILSQMSVLTLA